MSRESTIKTQQILVAAVTPLLGSLGGPVALALLDAIGKHERIAVDHLKKYLGRCPVTGPRVLAGKTQEELIAWGRGQNYRDPHFLGCKEAVLRETPLQWCTAPRGYPQGTQAWCRSTYPGEFEKRRAEYAEYAPDLLPRYEAEWATESSSSSYSPGVSDPSTTRAAPIRARIAVLQKALASPPKPSKGQTPERVALWKKETEAELKGLNMNLAEILGDISPILTAVSPLLPGPLSSIGAIGAAATRIASVAASSGPSRAGGAAPPSPPPQLAVPQGGQLKAPLLAGLGPDLWNDPNSPFYPWLGGGGKGPEGGRITGREFGGPPVQPSIVDMGGWSPTGTGTHPRHLFAATAGVSRRGVPGYFCPGGFHVSYKTRSAPGQPMCVPNRHMNPFNPRALSRAARRLQMFSHRVRKYVQICHPGRTVKVNPFRGRRSCKRRCKK